MQQDGLLLQHVSLLQHVASQSGHFEGQNGHSPGATQSLRGAKMIAWGAGTPQTSHKAWGEAPLLLALHTGMKRVVFKLISQ